MSDQPGLREASASKNVPLCFLYISAPIKATEIVFIWNDRGDPIVHFEYKTDSEQHTIAEILANWFGASISMSGYLTNRNDRVGGGGPNLSPPLCHMAI